MSTPLQAVEHVRPDGLVDSQLVFKGYQDADIRAYRVRPQGDDPRPAAIVIPEFRGIMEEIREHARELAKKGYVALVIEPFSRDQKPVDPDDMPGLFERMMKLSDTIVVEDLKAAATYLRQLPFVNGERIGAIGFCMGGLYARLLGCSDADITCVVEYYGQIKYDRTTEAKPKSPIELAPKLHCAYLGFFGAKDDFIPVEQVKELDAVFRAHDKNAVIEIYDHAGHAFLNHARDSYVESAAKDAWTKTLAFFTQHLKA